MRKPASGCIADATQDSIGLFIHRRKPLRSRHHAGGEASREKLIVFSRYPEPGKTKTRLIPSLGSEGAAELQRQMTEHTLAKVRQLGHSRPVAIEVRHEGGNGNLMREWLGPDLSYMPQGSGDFGERMANAFHEAFQAGSDRVVLVGTDCPGITVGLLCEAFESLIHTDVVLGPANDGGYYLIGLRQSIPQLFVEIPWGTEEVLERTREAVERLGLSLRLLRALDDVDRPEDLPAWREAFKEGLESSSPSLISIIIPTLNEGENIADTLASTRGAPDVEVVVVDGGSKDETVEIARSYGVKVILSSPARARQMNAGAAVATGEVFLFLHGDTCLPEAFDQHIQQTLAQPGTVAGAFQLHIAGHLRGLRFVERAANWRSRHLGLPYGDQAIFLRAGLFRSLGGFPEMPIMEDFEFIRRLRRRGRVGVAPAATTTSGRRWEDLGVWQTTVINYGIPVAYYLGVSPSRLARWYRRKRRML